MLIQRRNLLESVKPELVITEWTEPEPLRTEAAVPRGFTFSGIKNVGKGPALRVIVNASDEDGSIGTVIATTLMEQIIVAGDSSEKTGRVTIRWESITKRGIGDRYVFPRIRLLYWDTRNIRHEVVYILMATERPAAAGVDGLEVIPGIEMNGRYTTSRAVWLLKLEQRIRISRSLAKDHLTRWLKKLKLKFRRSN